MRMVVVFPAPFGSQKSEDFSSLYFQVYATYRLNRFASDLKSLSEPMCLDHRHDPRLSSLPK